MKGKIKERLKDYVSIIGVSGNEEEIVAKIKRDLVGVTDSVIVDPIGNIIAVKKGNKPGPKLMFAVHSDEVGMMVRGITPTGFITFDKVGLLPDLPLSGSKVLIKTKKGILNGVIGMKSAHLMSPEEGSKLQTAAASFIDIGATSKEEAEALGVEVGSRVVFLSNFMELPNDRISTRAIDNRVGCTVITELFNEIKEGNFAGEVYGVYTVQEEAALIGAQALAPAINKIAPDCLITIDTMPVADTPDANTALLPIFIGKGPVCAVEYGILQMGWSASIHPKVKEYIQEASKNVGVNVQYVTALGKYATDANAYVRNHAVAQGTLSIPRRYAHSPVEVMDLKDSEGHLKILIEMVKLNGKIKFTFE